MTPFGLHLRQLREAKGVSQKQMAQALNLSPAYLSALEHGKRGKPSYVLLQRIIGYFNIIWDEADNLHRLAGLSDPRVIIDTTDLSASATELANHLALGIHGLNEAQINDILNALKHKSG